MRRFAAEVVQIGHPAVVLAAQDLLQACQEQFGCEDVLAPQAEHLYELIIGVLAVVPFDAVKDLVPHSVEGHGHHLAIRTPAIGTSLTLGSATSATIGTTVFILGFTLRLTRWHPILSYVLFLPLAMSLPLPLRVGSIGAYPSSSTRDIACCGRDHELRSRLLLLLLRLLRLLLLLLRLLWVRGHLLQL